jgi:prepilin-type N-terminal cleavage/methylation domain-containing protein
MRATSARCLRSPEGLPRKGFTLLELLVVMALMALAAGLVIPAVLRGLTAAQERAVAGDMAALLNSLPVRAFQRGSDMVVDGRMLDQLLPDLPAGWQIVVPQALRYSSSGVAMGGLVRVVAPGRPPMEWVVGAINGHAERSTGAGAR